MARTSSISYADGTPSSGFLAALARRGACAASVVAWLGCALPVAQEAEVGADGLAFGASGEDVASVNRYCARDVGVSRSGVPWVTGTADGSPMTFLLNRQPGTTTGGPPAQALDRWIAIPGDAFAIASHSVDEPWIVGIGGVISHRTTGR